MKKIQNFAKELWKDESAQGTTEYILMLVVVVAIAIAFKDKILGVVKAKVDDLGGKIQGFTE